jgi:hypothetical protein
MLANEAAFSRMTGSAVAAKTPNLPRTPKNKQHCGLWFLNARE